MECKGIAWNEREMWQTGSTAVRHIVKHGVDWIGVEWTEFVKHGMDL